ncbi:hypothetical protein PoB_005784500 [Plakobranchus ocellatus]|uniref:Uncharacterized protein n=1 Tax=Plakobranchus ocellatus TaxID=259542 RepID=A0AAV4CHS0_9GAST|nr:hypothetical protein PoB_005784500 [Plakobranchus ocellatus]
MKKTKRKKYTSSRFPRIDIESITASMQLLESFRRARKSKSHVNLKQCENTITDMTRMTTSCFSDRKPALAKPYSSICSRSSKYEYESTQLLFGDNIHQRIKEVAEKVKLAHQSKANTA